MVAVMTVVISVIEKMCTTVTLLLFSELGEAKNPFQTPPVLSLHAVLLNSPRPHPEVGIQKADVSQGRNYRAR